MGEEADDILSSFELSVADQKKYKTVKGKFESYFVKRRNTIFERAKFNRRKQEEEEMIDEFILDLHRLAEHCAYGVLREEMIQYRIVVGLRNSGLSEKLQMDATLTLEKATAEARQSEAIKKQQSLLCSDFQESSRKSVEYLEKVKPFKGQGGSRWKPNHTDLQHATSKQSPKPSRCTRCGRTPTHSRQGCPARDEKCHKCGKKGHFQAMCRSSRNVGEVQKKTDEAFFGTVQNSKNTNPWAITLLVNGKPVEFKIDTGAHNQIKTDTQTDFDAYPHTPVPVLYFMLYCCEHVCISVL